MQNFKNFNFCLALGMFLLNQEIIQERGRYKMKEAGDTCRKIPGCWSGQSLGGAVGMAKNEQSWLLQECEGLCGK